MKTDFRTERRDLYAPSAKDFGVVEVPEFLFAMVDGQGDPNTSKDYARAVESLYSVSYAAKFASKGDWTGTPSSARSRGCGMPSTWRRFSTGRRGSGDGP